MIGFYSYRSGQVSVQLRNRGSDAFKHSEYGDSITIERRITADGGSSYKLKSRKGKFIFFVLLIKDENSHFVMQWSVVACFVMV